ncbi:MAG TPA: hypothetical protein GX507_10880, partial [Clostridia bacterium]|nr:hypothetical protein [Clostridia bacterium]
MSSGRSWNGLESYVSDVSDVLQTVVSEIRGENRDLTLHDTALPESKVKIETQSGPRFFRPTWAEVNLKVLKENVKELISLTAPGAVMMAVVKASSYGHGAVPVAKACLEAGAKWLGVALLEEALELRRAGITSPVLVLGAIPPEGMEVAVREEISFT